MKKWLLALMGVLFFAPAVFADNWGLGLKLGAGENDPELLKKWQDEASAAFTSSELDEGNGVFSLEALYEWPLDEEANKLGVKLGFDFYGENELKISSSPEVKFTENTFAVPLTVYYKRDNGVKKWSPFAGVGVSLFRSKTEVEGGSISEKYTKTKVAPHILAGVEYRFTQLFALGVEAKYTFGAKIKREGIAYSDRTGLSGALTGRFYF